ncbi:hypothetical protein FMN50_04735 [Rhodobacterales bacterium]|nr:hypothetical protein FMN50_04735 [Rhodobacterales bacterium]
MANTVHNKNSSLMAEYRALLVSCHVQKIQFRFGAIQLLPIDFRQLAVKLTDDESCVAIKIDRESLEQEGSLASYETIFNTFTFRSELVLREPAGRGEAVHEAVHAIFDIRDTMRMDLASECVCFLAGAMYHVITGTEASFLKNHNEKILDIAADVYKRGQKRFPEVTLSERIEIRKILRKNYSYKRGLSRGSGGLSSPYM